MNHIRNNSYPESVKDTIKRERYKDFIIQTETIQHFKQKDQSRTEHFANMGSPSSASVVTHYNWKTKYSNSISKILDYWLERKDLEQNKEIKLKSYAGFFYFIKWFVRALFLLFFTVLGTIGGKELGCEIKDHSECKTGVIELANSSPHIISSIVGSIFGLLLGQSLGKFIWDYSTNRIQRCLRIIEKKADQSKVFLIILSGAIYIINTTLFFLVFIFFIDIGQDKNNITGGLIGGGVGLICAVGAYRKASSCRSGEPETPLVYSIYNPTEDIPQLDLDI
jgi:hypothetical protein